MNAAATLVQSTIGKKVVMAATGILMILWLTIHMAGNMIVFAGEEQFNHYAHFIQSGFGVEPALLWIMRLGMLGAIGAHIWSAIGLTARNRSARPVGYAVARVDRATSYAARFMMLGSLVLLGFIFFHLAHLTVGTFTPDFDKAEAYKNLVTGLSNPLTAGFYILANMALAAHLHHGMTSGLQTLGLNHPRYNDLKARLGWAVPGLIAGGNIFIALSILAGFVAAPA